VRIATTVLTALVGLILAGCGNDGAELRPFSGPPSPEQKIKRTGNKWATLFAVGDRATCTYMTQPACERMRCERIGVAEPIKNCTPPSSEFRQSFEDAAVQDIAIKGNRAGAKFSNGETVELDHVSGYELGGIWWVHKYGGNAGHGNAGREFFE
jgi:hypothetical protein